MHLAYFDENKFADDNPYFWVGGLLIFDKKAIQFENTLSQIIEVNTLIPSRSIVSD